MNNIDLVLSILSVLSQLYVVYAGWRLVKVANFLDSWKRGWINFVIAAALITSLRGIWAYEIYTSHTAFAYIESVSALSASIFLLLFIYHMKKVFSHTVKETIASFDAGQLVDVAKEAAKELLQTANSITVKKVEIAKEAAKELIKTAAVTAISRVEHEDLVEVAKDAAKELIRIAEDVAAEKIEHDKKE